jgi:lipopolysaccharide biosynthesis protein
MNDSIPPSVAQKPRFIAFYLPQFYPTPYNDEWWGRGFTEWTNVTRAKPRFRGHYQPHLPADLGFYDLRVSETREAQASLAREYGIHGFCYYHYWFNGRRLLERPLDEVLALGRPDFPLCICWANENWTRTWGGTDRSVLVNQHYSFEDDLNHIRSLLPIFRDRRYIRVEGKPLLLVYRVESLPYPERTAEIWRNEITKHGFDGLYLVSVESNFGPVAVNPSDMGFDAALQFEPNRAHLFTTSVHLKISRHIKRFIQVDNRVSYDFMFRQWLRQATPNYRRFNCVMPMWDNTSRAAGTGAMIYHGSTPQVYQLWLKAAVCRTQPDNDQIRWVFINAWNEWAEGCHLEPCQKWGRSYLEATREVYNDNIPMIGV